MRASLLARATKEKLTKMINQYERVGVKEHCSLNFTKLVSIDYRTKLASSGTKKNEDASSGNNIEDEAKHQTRRWEMVQRTTRTIPWEEYQKSPATLAIDAVEICAIVKKQNEKFLLLVLQYRPPLDSLVLEFPAGLIDPNEDAKETVLRELLEETGYYATIEDIEYVSSPITPDPGLSDSCSRLVKVNVNGDDERNVNPQQHLEGEEDIEVVLIPITNRKKVVEEVNKLVALKEKNGERTLVDGKLFSYLVGMSS